MADSMGFDFSDINKLAADLGKVPDNAGDNIRKAVHVTSRKVRDGWREKLSGSSRLPHLPSSISWEVTATGTSITSEIGSEMGKPQASFAHLVEFGSVNGPGRGYGLKALEDNQSDFETGLTKAIADAERQSGL